MEPITAGISAVAGIAKGLIGGGSPPSPDIISTPFDGKVLDAKNISVAPGLVIGNFYGGSTTPPLSLLGGDAATDFFSNSGSGITTPLGNISKDVISGVIVGLILFVLLKRFK